MPRRTFPTVPRWGEAPLRPLLVDAITSSSAGYRVFLATLPMMVSAELAPALLKAGSSASSILSREQSAFAKRKPLHPGTNLAAPHAEWLTEAVYGIPELYSSEIAKARLVANPGCMRPA